MRRLALSAYVSLLLWGTLMGSALDPEPARVRGRLDLALSPPITALQVVDAIRNTALFAGWGVVWVATAPPPRHAVRLLFRAVAIGGGLSVVIETVQLFSVGRRASLFDVIANTAGVFLGGAITLTLHRWLESQIDRTRFLGIPMALISHSYGVATLLEAIAPVLRHASLARGGLRPRIHATASAFSHDPWLTFPMAEMILFAPAGALCLASLVEGGWSRGRAIVAVAGIGLAGSIVAEIAHLGLGIPMGIGPVVAHSLGIAAGAVALAFVPSLRLETQASRGLARGLLGLYAIVLLLWAWRPYHLETWSGVSAKLHSSWWTVFAAHHKVIDLISVSDIVVALMLYIPLGAVLAVRPLGATRPFSGPGPALWLAAATEFGQLFVWGRTLDITDALVQMAGVVVGWVLVRRSFAECR